MKEQELEITIKLTSKEAFSLATCNINGVKRRRIFGASPLKEKFYKQLREQITDEEFEVLKKEWKAIPDQESIDDVRERPIRTHLFVCKKCGGKKVGKGKGFKQSIKRSYMTESNDKK